MMVVFVSQCEKRALKRTRRVLDAFANRIGDNTWQTVITEDGLIAVKKLLRATATKNTAVSCHWFRTRIRLELLWIVGNRNKFNNQGIVPVNRTGKEVFMDVTKIKQEQFYANTQLQILSEHLFAVGYIAVELFKKSVNNQEEKLLPVVFLAGCLHDIGKIEPIFQDWLKKQKKHILEQDDGCHITTKFTFEKHPRHNEISLILCQMLLDKDHIKSFNKVQKNSLKHVIYWHHAKPYRKSSSDDFTKIEFIYKVLNSNIGNGKQFFQILTNALLILQEIILLADNNYYSDLKKIITDHIVLGGIDSKKLLEYWIENDHNSNVPDFKLYDSKDAENFSELQNRIKENATNNLLRSCVISADRLVSAIAADDLSEFIKDNRLKEILLDKQEVISNLTSYINLGLSKFPNSERSKLQEKIAKELADVGDVAVLSGAAGCGKTKIALEWAKNLNAQKIIWICPRVQICQGIFQELIETYLPEANIEIFTGEFKYTNSWNNPTLEEKYFAGDVVITTIDQLLDTIGSIAKVKNREYTDCIKK